MGRQHRFTAPLESSGNGMYVSVPFDVESVFGKKRVPVNATIDGVAYRGSLVRMGGTCHVLGVTKEIRTSLGKGEGDVVEVVLEEDVAPRVVEVPADFRAALDASPEAARFFGTLSYTYQREYVRWIDEAKRETTRAARITRGIERLSQGEKQH